MTKEVKTDAEKALEAREPDPRPGLLVGERGPHVCAGHNWYSWQQSCPQCWVISFEKQLTELEEKRASH